MAAGRRAETLAVAAAAEAGGTEVTMTRRRRIRARAAVVVTRARRGAPAHEEAHGPAPGAVTGRAASSAARPARRPATGPGVETTTMGVPGAAEEQARQDRGRARAQARLARVAVRRRVIRDMRAPDLGLQAGVDHRTF